MSHIAKLPGLIRQAKREGWSEWIRSPADEMAMLNGCVFDFQRAVRFESFCNRFLRLFQGKFRNTPVELLPWQRDQYTFPLYGWVRTAENGRRVRRYRRSYCQIAKKNGKSTLVAAQCLFHLTADGEAGAEVYAVANDEKQSGRIFSECNRMVVCSPVLHDVIRTVKSELMMTYPRAFGALKAISSNPASAEGMNASALFGDEMHKWKGRELFDCIQWAGIARDQPLLGIITTAGDDTESVCFEEYLYACAVRDGTIIDEQYLPVVFEADAGCDLLDETQWPKANPSLGTTLSIDDFRKDAQRAARTPRATAAFRRYRLDQWVAAGDRWIKPEQWSACHSDFDPESLVGKWCIGGLDLSRVSDTTSLQLLFRLDGGRRAVLSYFWLPEATVANLQDRVNYRDWQGQGHIKVTEGEVQDYDEIKQDILGLHNKYKIKNLVFDPYNAENLTQDLERRGVRRWAMAQNIKYFTAAVDDIERRVLAKTIEHRGNLVMNYQMGNCRIVQNSDGGKKPLKKNTDSILKIDGPVAMLMATAGDLEAGENEGGGVGIRWM